LGDLSYKNRKNQKQIPRAKAALGMTAEAEGEAPEKAKKDSSSPQRTRPLLGVTPGDTVGGKSMAAIQDKVMASIQNTSWTSPAATLYLWEWLGVGLGSIRVKIPALRDFL
jgi:hypothetical protein